MRPARAGVVVFVPTNVTPACPRPTGTLAAARAITGLATEGLVDRGVVDPGRLERVAAAAMRQSQRCDASHVLHRRLEPTLPTGKRRSGATDHEIRPQTLRPHRRAQPAHDDQELVGELRRLRPSQSLRKRRLRRPPGAGEPRWIRVVGQPAPYGLGPGLGVGRRPDLDRKAEAIEELRAQLALLGVHRAHEHEAGRMSLRHALALHSVDPAGRDVQQHVHQVIGQEVDLVDVQDASVGLGQEAGMEPPPALGERRLEVEGPGDPILGRPHGKLDEAGPSGQERRQPPGERGLRAPLVAAQQHPSDARGRAR